MTAPAQAKLNGPLGLHETLEPASALSAGVLKVATITVTNAQIKQDNVPVILVPSPGANKALVPVFAVLYSHIIAPYTNIDPTGSYLQVWNGAGGGFELTPLPNSPGSKLSDILTGDHNLVLPIAAVNDANYGLIPYNTSLPGNNNDMPLIFQISNYLNGNLTGGNAGNFIRVTVVYYELDQS